MSITDELRGFANSGMSAMECSAYSDKLIAIADRIDKTHEEELAKLKAENAKLRNEVDNLLDFEHLTSVAVAYAGCDECGEYKQTMLRLFADNAKLRELLTFYLGCLTKGHVNCDSCAFAEDVCEHGRKVIDWARNLGVEVDE